MTYRHIEVLTIKILSVILVLSLIAAVQIPGVNAQNVSSVNAQNVSSVNAQNATNTSIAGVAPQGVAKLLEQQAPNLEPSANYTNASFVQAGIGLRNVGSGHISLDVPANATILKAYLYWTHLAPRATGSFGIQGIYLNGELIKGSLIGSDQDPCWGQGNIFVNFADVTNTILRRGGPVGDQYISIASGDVTSRSPWDATPSKPFAESAHLLIVYRDKGVSSGNVIIYQPNLTSGSPITFIGGTTSFTANFPPHTSNQAFVGYALADGQIFGSPQSKSFVWTASTLSPTTLAEGQVFGRDPSITSKASVRGSLSDTQTFDVSGNTPVGTSSAQLGWDFSNDCLTTIYAVVQM